MAQAATGAIVIEEQIDGGVGPGFNFASEVGANTGTPTSLTLGPGEQGAISGLAPGTYNVVQAEPESPFQPDEGHFWELSAINCDDANSTGDLAIKTATIRVEPGETVKCTFRNRNLRTGAIVIEEQIDGGVGPGFSFASEVGANTGTPTSLTLGPGEQRAISGLAPGTYNVVQTDNAGWALSAVTCDDADSTGDLSTRTATFRVELGETVTCTFRNATAPASVGTGSGTIVVRTVTDPAGADAQFDFLSASGTPGYPSFPDFPLRPGESAQVTNLLPGTYGVVERDPRFSWRLAQISCDDSDSEGDLDRRIAVFRVQAGETVTCTFRNEYLRTGRIVVVKQAEPAGADAQFDFLSASGTPGYPSFPDFPLRPGESAQVTNLLPGTYGVVERDPRFSWRLAQISCDDSDSGGDLDRRIAVFRVQAGETVTCTFLNRSLEFGAIVVRKQTSPPGDPQTFGFATSYDADGFTLGDGESNDSGPLAAGMYSVSEDALLAWDSSVACSDGSSPRAIQLTVGETVTCMFTNTKRGVARVVKTVNGVAPSGSQSFAFQLRQGASTTSAGSILESRNADAGNGGAIGFTTTLVPGTTYALCEIVMPGWTTTLGPLAYVVYEGGDNSTLCTDFGVQPGATKIFVIDNTPPQGGLARTIGFWKNWASCASSKGNQEPELDQTLAAAGSAGIAVGTLVLGGGDCLEAVRLLDKSTIDTAKKMASDPAFSLAAQLVAAELNLVAGAGACPSALTAVSGAQTLLFSTHFDGIAHDNLQRSLSAEANALAVSLDRYNNNLLC